MGKTTGGEAVAAMLAAEGIDRVFGLPDGSYHGLIDGLDRHDIELVTPRHESTALHMAGAYARLTGRLGVAIASNGPGVANALPGIAVENAEGNRVLLLTSSRRVGITFPDRTGTYQCFDQVGVISSMAKESTSARGAARVPELMHAALRRSFIGRPGVVHLDVPESVLNAKADFPPPAPPASYRRTAPLPVAPALVTRVADLLVEADFPVVHAGGGVIHARAFDRLAELAELLHLPVTTSWSGAGAIAHTHPLAWPISAIESTDEVRNRADLVLVLGSRLGETDWWGKAPHWRPDQIVVHVDVDEAVLGLNKPLGLGIVADMGSFLDALVPELAVRKPSVGSRRAEVDDLRARRDRRAEQLVTKYLDEPGAPMLTAHVPAVAREVLPDDTILVADGGNTTVWTAFFWEIRHPGTTLGTPHFGHLGAGVGQALGAAEAAPDRVVCCIIGDGAFGMHPQEIETAVRRGNRIVFLVVADRQWGMVKMTQSMARHPVKMLVRKQLAPGATTGTDLGEIAYDALARSMGAHGERAADPIQLRAAIERAVASDGCAVVHVDVDPARHLWAPGLRHFKQMHLEPKGGPAT